MNTQTDAIPAPEGMQPRPGSIRGRNKTPMRSREENRRLRLAIQMLYREGTYSQYQLARELKVPHSTVQVWCSNEFDAKARREKRNRSAVGPKEELEILRLYKEDLNSVENIAKRIGVPRSRVARVLDAHLSRDQRREITKLRSEQEQRLRISMIRRWVNGQETYRTLERDRNIPRSTMSNWVRRPDIPADLRAQIADKLPKNHRRATKRDAEKTRMSGVAPAPRVGAVGPGEALSAHAVQAMIADLGLAAGYAVWIPANDRARVAACMVRTGLAEVWPARALPDRLDAIVRNIDVIWLQDGIITHCYEVEHATMVTTGIARIRDAQDQFPSFFVRGYIVGEAGKQRKFAHEAHRPSMGANDSVSEMRPISFLDQQHLRGIGARAGAEWIPPASAQAWLDEHAVP